MKPTRKQAAIGAASVLLLVLMIRGCGEDGATGPARAMVATVERGDLTVTVRASGEILAREANRIIPKIKRGTVVSFLVPEGSRVKRGEVIARFATEDIDNRISDAEATLADRELRVLSAQTDYEIQILDNSNSLKVARDAVSDAEMELKKFLEGDEPGDLRAARLKIETSISKHERSIRKHDEAKALLKDGFITEDQVEEERIAMETAEVDAETARIDLQMLEQYDLPLRRNKATSALEKAQTELEKTIKKNEVQEQRKQQELESALRQRDRAVQDLAALREERKDLEIIAPTDGVVNYGDPANPWRRGDIQAGMSLNPGEVLMTIPDLTAMQAHINVSEADVDKVKAGQRAQVFVEAVDRQVFSGEVERVAEVANAGRWMSTDVKEFQVRINIENGNGLRPGYTCDAEIVVDTAAGILLLPIQAVFRDGDGWAVYKGSPDRARKIPVQIGRASVTHVEITSGLEEGERVLLNPAEE